MADTSASRAGRPDYRATPDVTLEPGTHRGVAAPRAVAPLRTVAR